MAQVYPTWEAAPGATSTTRYTVKSHPRRHERRRALSRAAGGHTKEKMEHYNPPSHIGYDMPIGWFGDRPDWKMSPLERSQVWRGREGDIDPAKRNRARRAKRKLKARR